MRKPVVSPSPCKSVWPSPTCSSVFWPTAKVISSAWKFACCNAISLGLAVVAPGPCLVLFDLLHARCGQRGNVCSGTSIVYEFTDAENRATYIPGWPIQIPGVAIAIAPLIGGVLVSVISYQTIRNLRRHEYSAITFSWQYAAGAGSRQE